MRLYTPLASACVLAFVASQAVCQQPNVIADSVVIDTPQVRRSTGWSAGAELLLVTPRFESNPAFFVTSRTVPVGGLPPANAQRVEEFSYSLGASPRVWIGYTLDSGFGARVRWFHFDQNSRSRNAVNPVIPLGSSLAFQSISSTSPLMAIAPQVALPAVNSIQTQGKPGVDEQLAFASRISIDLWDVDGVFTDIRTGAWEFEVFGGVRIANIEQTYSAVSQGLAPQNILSKQTFDGVGPSFGLSGRRGLFDSGLSFYGLGRLSFLFGEDDHSSTGLNIGLVPDFAYAFHGNRSSRVRILPIIDIEMGLEANRQIGNAEAFARAGVFSQLVPLGSAANGNGNAGLIGLSLGAGVRF